MNKLIVNRILIVSIVVNKIFSLLFIIIIICKFYYPVCFVGSRWRCKQAAIKFLGEQLHDLIEHARWGIIHRAPTEL